jgi:hypothetical protein
MIYSTPVALVEARSNFGESGSSYRPLFTMSWRPSAQCPRVGTMS